MRIFSGVLLALLATTPILAKPEAIPSTQDAAPATAIQSHWECVPIARALSGIQIFGNAHTWWGQADGRYARGQDPKRGAVLAFRPHGSMRLGHVAAVSRVVDERTILLTHSNWSPINGRRGQIERNVKAIDVSTNNDWTMVKVWYTPTMDLGTTAWPTHGFIYPDGAAPMTLPGNARVAATMAGIIAKPTTLAHDRQVQIASKDKPKPTRIVKEKTSQLDADRKLLAKAQLKAEKKRDKELEKLAKKEDKKKAKVLARADDIAPTGRLDYMRKMLKNLP